jgi:ammonia channel protein AmtB
MLRKDIKRWAVPFWTVVFLSTICGIASAQSDGPTTKEIGESLNIMWMLIAGFLVFFMQAGFALVETGFTRAKNVSHTMMMNMMVFCIGAVGYWLVGFGLQFGAVNFTYPAVRGLAEWAHSPTTLGDWKGLLAAPLLHIGQFGFLGGSGFALSLTGSGILAFFLFQMVFMDTAATIPTGSTAERLKFSGFVLMAFWVSMFIYPLLGNWIWGGGWLQNLGRSLGIGNGAVDFAGSGVVHMIGGSVALAGAIAIGRASADSIRTDRLMPCRATTFPWEFSEPSSCFSAGSDSTRDHHWHFWEQGASLLYSPQSTRCWPARPEEFRRCSTSGRSAQQRSPIRASRSTASWQASSRSPLHALSFHRWLR